MTPRKGVPKNIDEYISEFPQDVQRKLRQLRAAIKAAAPRAKETISYRIPTFTLRGNLVHFAAFQHHLSFFPTSSPITAFKKQLARYVVSRGTIRLPMDSPLPLALIRRIVKFRVNEMRAKHARKK